MFSKILIANRGEIACRIIETAKRLGVKTVAIYSDIDAKAKHVSLADEAYCIGTAPSALSYLRGDTIIEVAKQTGAEAIHPGYGFLAENADFAQACADNGLAFIGPSAKAIEAMGSKTAAKIVMKQHNVPTTPGYEGDNQDTDFLIEQAKLIGFPILFKASAGGGGKGMRLVTNDSDIHDALISAKREALSSFGNGDMLIEKYLVDARHVEVQIFCDTKGNGVYLYDRDCSVQRRHQKIIEEAPAPGIADSTKQAMGQAALQAAKAIDYCGAGTVEFLYCDDGSFYFMEMNTRLQVEHPVTEKVTGIDLVEWQLLVASGQALPLKQNEIKITGHAFEARICAEDPTDDFKPSCGQIDIMSFPKPSEHIRIDSGVRAGDSISPYYDPMIAKLITWGIERDSALQQLHHALSDTIILGVSTNIDLLNAITLNEDFKQAKLSTRFLDNHSQLLSADKTPSTTELALATIGFQFLSQQHYQRSTSNDPYSPWNQHDHWRLNSHQQTLHFWHNDNDYRCVLASGSRPHHFSLCIEGDDSIDTELCWHEQSWFDIKLNNESHRARMILYRNQLIVFHNNASLCLLTEPPGSGDMSHGGQSELAAPMPGTIIDVLVNVGDEVNPGDKLIVMEAMKMETTLKAPYAGIVSQIHFNKGNTFAEGDELLAIDKA